MVVTTIQIENSLKEKLDSLKLHNRETYNELISRLANLIDPEKMERESLIETIEVLSDPETMKNISEALKEYNSGNKGKNLQQIKKELGL